MNARKLLAGAALAVFCASPAFAAGYLKIGDIKGESTAASMQRGWIAVDSASLGETRGVITVGEDPVAIGLLLPAVQKARRSSLPPPAKSKKVGHLTYRETDGGRAGKTYWLKNVEISPAGESAGAHRLQLDYDCMDWRDDATGDTGGQCGAARKKKGNVETEWKVEEGE